MPLASKCINYSSTVSSFFLLTGIPSKLSPARFVTCFFLMGPRRYLFSLYSLPLSFPLLCCPFYEQVHLLIFFLRWLIPSLLALLMYALLTVGLLIVILNRLFSCCCFHLWSLNRSPPSTSLPFAICTVCRQVLLLQAPLPNNSRNAICIRHTVLSISIIFILVVLWF